MGFLWFLINTIINYYGYVGFGWLVLGGGFLREISLRAKFYVKKTIEKEVRMK